MAVLQALLPVACKILLLLLYDFTYNLGVHGHWSADLRN